MSDYISVEFGLAEPFKWRIISDQQGNLLFTSSLLRCRDKGVALLPASVGGCLICETFLACHCTTSTAGSALGCKQANNLWGRVEDTVHVQFCSFMYGKRVSDTAEVRSSLD